MHIAHRSLGAHLRASGFVIRPRISNASGRALQRSIRQPRRQQSSHTSAKPDNSTNQNAKSHAHTLGESAGVARNSASKSASSATTQPPNTSAVPATAGAAAASSPANVAVRSKGIRAMISAGPVGQLGRWYSRVQERRPYMTQLCSSVVVYLFGDLSAQLLFPSDPPQPTKFVDQTGQEGDDEQTARGGGYDPWRTVRHLMVGAGSSIPSYNWFMFLHNNFNYPSKFLSILTKVVVQQICFTPVFNTYFFSMHSLLAGATIEETWERLKKALPVSVTNSVKLWPAVTAFSFMYVPAQFRNVFAGVIAVGWQTYLSWLNQKAAREVLAAEMAADSRTTHRLPAMADSQASAAASAAA
ncbi:Uncharacterized protein PECH_007952 [Penicillium ucsense]|uniref:Uncharacterized protein n=1 Tax=Penicillium ucsense TaxID=2839758 RepID=A0A8J8W3N7_9EURO|nr:Uncharacterized protein PECM_004151 [Penicillium ucsense]KAF7734501.1 Uncharacterized protein PECH_007952 [Penicillium ucsense]